MIEFQLGFSFIELGFWANGTSDRSLGSRTHTHNIYCQSELRNELHVNYGEHMKFNAWSTQFFSHHNSYWCRCCVQCACNHNGVFHFLSLFNFFFFVFLNTAHRSFTDTPLSIPAHTIRIFYRVICPQHLGPIHSLSNPFPPFSAHTHFEFGLVSFHPFFKFSTTAE